MIWLSLPISKNEPVRGSLIKDKHSYLEKFVINEVKSGKFRGPVGPSGPAGHPGPAGVKGERGIKGETGDILTVKVKLFRFIDQSDYSVLKRWIKGEKGNQGDDGRRGEPGFKGEPGRTGMIFTSI